MLLCSLRNGIGSALALHSLAPAGRAGACCSALWQAESVAEDGMWRAGESSVIMTRRHLLHTWAQANTQTVTGLGSGVRGTATLPVSHAQSFSIWLIAVVVGALKCVLICWV